MLRTITINIRISGPVPLTDIVLKIVKSLVQDYLLHGNSLLGFFLHVPVPVPENGGPEGGEGQVEQVAEK